MCGRGFPQPHTRRTHTHNSRVLGFLYGTCLWQADRVQPWAVLASVPAASPMSSSARAPLVTEAPEATSLSRTP